MRKYLLFLLIIASGTVYHGLNAQNNNVGIGTTQPDSSAKLEIRSTEKGILIPRMTQMERDAIVNPATGLMIYQTDNNPCFYYYDGNGWGPVGCGLSGGGGGPSNMSFTFEADRDTVMGGVGTTSHDTTLLRAIYMGGTGSHVGFNITGLPPGVTTNLNSSGGFPDFQSILTFNIGPFVTPGTYNVLITAEGGLANQADSLVLMVALVKTVFVTASSWNGNLGGLAGADAKCNSEALAGGIPGNYVAWLSTNAPIHAKDRITDAIYIRTDTVIVADNLADLIDGGIDNSIDIDQFGNPLNNVEVHSGTDQFGLWTQPFGPTPVYTCTNWTSGSSVRDHHGFSGSVNSSWTEASFGTQFSCSKPRHLYCFEL